MPQGGFEVGADLDAHATQLDAVVDQLTQALEAAQQVSMPTDAYGILCQPFRMMLDPVEQFGIDALSDSVEAMQATADKVRKAAEQYRTTDETYRDSMRGGDV
ncbi:type VII secretion target [Saccharomonospora xinjiangensis]|uniref:type VII secretion target n=1 Tax=Saccharomonospora xinjiangensis TaxID=75294 RepID=UPI00106F1797|nr:type VII secretion target [Saccharomonospora xinjiangensis]QBQ60982.1 hypothetical protein EYD13_13145 [Saccharomonospora xinjiangensis]